MTAILFRNALSFILLSALFLSLSVSLVFAQETTVANTETDAKTTQISQAGQNSDRIQLKRKTALERNLTAKENFREKLLDISDEAKSAALERINSALETINTNKTARWAQVLDTFSEILERIKTKVSTAQGNGVDVTQINGLIETAESAIAAAVTGVEQQAENDYIIEITDENGLRGAVAPVIQQFKQDLRATLVLVKNARDALRQVARALVTLNTGPAGNSEIDTQTTL